MPEKFGRYEIEFEIDRGGMGTVYQAYDPLFDRKVALKVLLPQTSDTFEEARARFILEAKTIARMEHAAIVPVYDYGEHDKQLYFIMRLMKGQSLAEHLEQGPFSTSLASDIIKRLGGALDMAHKNGIVHRDLKPANILFDGEGKVYLSDFGIAKIAESTSIHTKTGSILGTFPYMSPEQFQSKQKVDYRADIYALGVILYEMLAGQKPFQVDTPAEWIGAHLNDPVPFIHEVRSDLPSDYEIIVEKAMAKAPEDRFESAGQMAEALETLSRPNMGAQEREAYVSSLKMSGTVDTMLNRDVGKRPFSPSTLLKWLPWFLLVALVIGMLAILPTNLLGRFGFQATVTHTPTPQQIAPAQFTTTTIASAVTTTPQPVIEGIIVFILYDPASAIFQRGESGIERIPENSQLPLPTSGEPVFLQSNAGSMELLLPDKTRLFIDKNTSLSIEQVRDVNESEQTQIMLNQGLVVVSNESDLITMTAPNDIQVKMNTGMLEVEQSDTQRDIRVNIDCINGICPVFVGEASELTLQEGKSTSVTGSDAVADIGTARYDLYNNVVTGLFITPTPTSTPSPSPTPTNTLEPTGFGPETIVIGESVNKQSIEAVKFGDGPDVVIFIGGLHVGFAPGTVTLARESITYFTEQPEKIPENVTLYIIPSANPDSPLAVGDKEGRLNANGVDLNRNWNCTHEVDAIIGGKVVPGSGGPKPFSEPEVIALRDFILNNTPNAVVFWMARASNGYSSPGACFERNPASDELAAIYGAAANYDYVEEIENTLGFVLHGDAMNWLSDQGIPTIGVLLRDYVEPDFQRNLAGIQAVLNDLPDIPTPGPGTDEIVFQSNRDGDFEIYIMNIDGSNQRQLTDNDVDDKYPRVSPDGRYISYSSVQAGNSDIYIMNRNGSNQQQLTIHTNNDWLPSFSPDSQQIIFSSERSGIADLYIVNIDGTGLQRIAETSAREGRSDWSVQNKLVFNVRIESYWEIYTSDLDNSNRQILTDNDSLDDWSPQWSPDGTQILFHSEQESSPNSGIYLMNADGSDVRLLYNEPLEEWGASWSADGSQILFAVEQPDDTADIYIMDIDEPEIAQRLIERGSYPSWAVAISPTAVSTIPAATPTPACLTDALSRWRENIYPEFADRLGCVRSPEKHGTAVYQIYENGLMVWQTDSDFIYVLYTDSTYGIHPDTSPLGTEFYLNDETKSVIGYLWANNLSVQSLLGKPRETAMGTSEFTLQEFENGTIFYFKENQANTYVLMADQNELRMIQEK